MGPRGVGAPTFDDAKKALFAVARGRATTVPAVFEETDMRALFETHVARSMHARASLTSSCSTRSSSAAKARRIDIAKDDDVSEGKNPLASFVAACAFRTARLRPAVGPVPRGAESRGVLPQSGGTVLGAERR